MSVQRRLTRHCTLRYQAPGPADAQGNPASLWTEVATVCEFQQRGRQEIGDMGQLSDTTWVVTLLPTELPPLAADELVIDGIVYQFRGDSWPAHTLSGRLDHIEATAGRAQ